MMGSLLKTCSIHRNVMMVQRLNPLVKGSITSSQIVPKPHLIHTTTDTNCGHSHRLHDSRHHHDISYISQSHSRYYHRRKHSSSRDDHDGYSKRESPGSRRLIKAGFMTGILSSLGMGNDGKEVNKDDPLILIIKKGILAMNKADYEKAEEILHEALKMAYEMKHTDAQNYIYTVLADIAMEVREMDKAASLYKEVLRRVLSTGKVKENDESVIEISLQLASIYTEQRDMEKAEEGFTFCLNHQRARVQPLIKDIKDGTKKKGDLTPEEENSLALYGMVLDWWGKYLLINKQYTKAKAALLESYEMATHIHGLSEEQVIILLSDLGVVSELMGDLDGAITYLKMAIEQGLKNESADLAVFYYNLGMCFLKKKDRDNAAYCCSKGFKMGKDEGRTKLAVKCRKCMMAANEL